MKIAVTGANGYLGSGIVRELLNDGHDVVAVSRRTDNIDNDAKIISKNIFDMENPFQEMGKPDVILHAAWQDGFIHDSKRHIENLDKHVQFIDKLMKSDVKRISVLGTVHEIGFFEGSVDENTSTNPITNYGIAKNAMRQVTESLAMKYNKQFQWIRAFYIVGDKDMMDFDKSVFGKVVRAASDGKTVFPFVEGKNQFDFIDYQDFVRNVILTITQSKIHGIINVSSGRPEPILQRMERFLIDNDLTIKLDVGAFPDRPYDAKAIWGNSAKLDAIIGENL